MTFTQDKMALLHYRPAASRNALQRVFERNKEQKAVEALQKLFPSLREQPKDKQNG